MLRNLLKKLKIIPSSEDNLSKSQELLVDFGSISFLTPISKQIMVSVEASGSIRSTVDCLSIFPETFSLPGSHQVTVTLKPEMLVPGALLEGSLVIETQSTKRLIRVTGFIENTGILEKTSSVIFNNAPWGLIKKFSCEPTRIRSIAFVNNGESIVTGSDDCQLRWIDINSARIEKEQYPASIWSLASTRDGKLLALGLQDGTITVLDSTTRESIWSQKIHSGMIAGLAFTPDASVLVAGSGDRTLSVWNTQTGQLLYRPISAPSPNGKKPGVITSVAVSSNGLVLAASSQTRNIDLWEVQTGQHLRQLNGHMGNVWAVVFSLDGHLLVSGSYDKTVRLWDTQSGKDIRKIEGFNRDIYSIAVSPNGKLIATASGEPKVRIWDADSGNRLANLENGYLLIWKLSFAPTQKLLAGALDSGEVYLWTVGNETEK